MSNNNGKLRKEVVLPPSGSGSATNNGVSTDKDSLKARLSEISSQTKLLGKEATGIKKQLAKISASSKKKKTVKKTTRKKSGKK